jgi:polysaccharide export outer membrane protein
MNEKRISPWIFLVLVVVAVGLSSGCDSSETETTKTESKPVVVGSSACPADFLRTDWVTTTKGPNACIRRRPYRLREADQVEIIYHVQTRRSEEAYRVKIRDIITAKFPFHPELNVEEAVQSDGTLQLSLIGSVPVFDKTIDEIKADLLSEYARYLRKPILTVGFKESKRDITDLRESIATSPRGMSRLVPITPDGTAALPLIGNVKLGGRTIDELRGQINEAYHEVGLIDLEVTINIETIAPMRVYVMGEVKKPGLILNNTGGRSGNTQMSILQALAQAGGYFPARAELSKVLLVRKRNVPGPQVAIVNLFKLLGVSGEDTNPRSAKFRHDVWLEDGDLIYVPTKELARRADYIEYVWTRGIYAVVPISYSMSANYSVVDVVDWLGPNPL